ncbi:trehalose operon repressor [Marinithermofilum abyssi]|uniref:Trehalose operon repressor n=1 Tax=Marinithermofilum abyssi TaxID=1571185 RepID=A0A8J2VFP7_9BACL|nr:trehalose operon repressor [Marinithermofilum abyssi]GGE29816.1 trehalose operon repressor [Marinithermofilum abyssi]
MDNIYLTIYHDFVRRIESGRLRPNAKLPSENELAQLYETSRETVRKALHLLSQNGYIHKIKGKGSFVLPLPRFDFPVSGLVSFKELASKMKKPCLTKVHRLQQLEATPFLADQLQIKPGDPVWEAIRIREIGGEKIILDKDHFRADCIPPLTEAVCRDSIYEYLEHTMDRRISFAKKIITVDEPTEEDRELLDFQAYPMIAVVQNYVYLEDGTLFQYTESRHRPDKFRFVDFARRH